MPSQRPKGMLPATRPGFEEYVTARSGPLLRFAYLLCGDRHLAEDLVQEVLVKAHRRWSAIEADNPDSYLKRALVRTHISWLRRRASSEVATAAVPDRPGAGFRATDAAGPRLVRSRPGGSFPERTPVTSGRLLSTWRRC